jgi:hypothetical protein
VGEVGEVAGVAPVALAAKETVRRRLKSRPLGQIWTRKRMEVTKTEAYGTYQIKIK